MPNAGNTYTINLKEPHIGWGTYRNTDSRDSRTGEGYIPIPREYATQFNIFNQNHPNANALYHCTSTDGNFKGILLAQGSSTAGDTYAKQFAEKDNLKGIGDWYKSLNAKVGDSVRVTWISPTDMTIELI